MSIFSQIRSILGKNEQEESAATPDKAKTVDAASMTATPGAPVERRSRKRINTHKGRRILIIDDSPTIVGALKKMLRSAGCITLEAADAETGLELIRKEKPELVFLDIVLPGMTGFAALRQMRRDPLTLHIPVIMISGNEQATEQFYVKRIGADDFMKKPFSRHEVFARIESLVEEKKLKQLLAPQEKPVIRPKTAADPMQEKAPRPTTPAQKPHASGKPIQEPAVGESAPKAKAPISALEARKHLTDMGLQYFSQEQFVAAIERGDKLAVELFIAGGCVSINA
jgi:twitching motility two-component system response regulator PilH